ncbi:MAG TPA: FtsX-like permease family protein [Steroidobacteraceae bacterium]|nr:FtsX-like permease family protein [Steroidobacteraceae bacterium]
MELGQILSSLRRNKAAVALITLQIAVTLAVLCNGLFIIQQQTRLSRSPSGVQDEAGVFIITNQWVGSSSDGAAREQSDLAALRGLPQVEDATVSVDHPLGGAFMGEGITVNPSDPKSGAFTMVYPVDGHAIHTLGLKLIAGRNFRPEEVVVRNGFGQPAASLAGAIVTEAVARQLAPDGKVLGRIATMIPDGTRVPIIGIVERLQSTPLAGDAPLAAQSILLPYLWSDSQIFYIVRAKPGQFASATTAARNALYGISRDRIVIGIQSFAEARRDAYRSARGVALIMGVISAILLSVTAFGIFGLTNYWVSQRTRYIGIRRALGATRGTILRYFQSEILLITVVGSILGVSLALAANFWMLRSIALTRLPPTFLIVGVIGVFALGQLAVLWPALRGSWISPALATRSV